VLSYVARTIRHMSPDAGRVAEVTKQAAEIAKGLPENLQEAAFNRAFDALSESGAAPARAAHPRADKPASAKARARKASPAPAEQSKDAVDVLVAKTNRTEHPEVNEASIGLDRALHLLRIAHTDHGIDGLSAIQIAKVLTEKFRHPTTHQAIRQALNGAGNYVDYVPQTTGAAIYRLMGPGEKYLDAGGANIHGGPKVEGTKPKPKRRRGTTKKPNRSSKGEDAPSRKRSGKGPKSMIEELIDGGFFASPKGISDIQQQLRNKRGVTFKATDLSPALVRLLRQKSLDRERNDSNQFEYSVPS
jgi:hypothetical protein